LQNTPYSYGLASGGEFVFIPQHKIRTKLVATRHDFWAQNVPTMILQLGLRPEPRWGAQSTPPDPQLDLYAVYVNLWGRFAEKNGEERERKGRGKRGRGRKSRGTEKRGGERKGGGLA